MQEQDKQRNKEQIDHRKALVGARQGAASVSEQVIAVWTPSTYEREVRMNQTSVEPVEPVKSVDTGEAGDAEVIEDTEDTEALFRRAMAGAADMVWDLGYDEEALAALHDVIEEGTIQQDAVQQDADEHHCGDLPQ